MALSQMPVITKGSLVALDILNPLASIVVFQYNPSQLSRTLQAQISDSENGDRDEAMRFKGAPIETISLQVDIDATDQLDQATALISGLGEGIYPQLAALEMMIYPKSAYVVANTIALNLGTLEVLPTMAPLTFFIWGPKRVLPVKITQFSIMEQMYDANLNPIRAQVDLGLRVLSYNDLSVTNPSYYVYLANQVSKETMATQSSLIQMGTSLTQILSSI